MVIDLLGILEDGSTRDARVPLSAAKPLILTKGTVATLRLSIIRPSGEKVVISDLTSPAVYLTAKVKSQSSESKLLIAGTLKTTEGPNRYDFLISANATKFLDPGRFVYDVWLETSTTRDPIVPLSPFILQPAVRLPT